MWSILEKNEFLKMKMASMLEKKAYLVKKNDMFADYIDSKAEFYVEKVIGPLKPKVYDEGCEPDPSVKARLGRIEVAIRDMEKVLQTHVQEDVSPRPCHGQQESIV